jgi:nucleoside-diphosphate-sugar epimerase
MSKLIFGCGYLGLRVAKLWKKQGHSVWTVTRSEERSLQLGMEGMLTAGADVTKSETLRFLKTLPDLSLASEIKKPNETVLFAVGYDRASGMSIHEVYVEGFKNVLDALPADIGRLIYISTTGVYGSAGGEWVDEETPPDPQRDGGRASLAAEQALAQSPFASRGIVLRLAGIYGPGRVPYLDKLRAGEPIPAPSQCYLNLIHVDDAAAVVVAAEGLSQLGNGPRIYCVSDGHPVERGEYYREVARLVGAPPPKFIAPEPNSPRAARAAADRRGNNARMLADLGIKLTYPDYRAGLAAILGG